MYYISIVDRNNKKLEILKDRSQAKIDEFTTYFKNPDEILVTLGLNPYQFRVIVEKQLTKSDEPEEISFLNNSYRGVSSYVDNRKKTLDLFYDASRMDKDTLKDFFYNEYLLKESNNYDVARKKRLDNVVNQLNDKTVNTKRVEYGIRDYFIDQFNKLNYDRFKSFYKYLVMLDSDFIKKQELNEIEELERDRTLLSISKVVNKALDERGSYFSNERLPRAKTPLESMKDDPYRDVVRNYQYDDDDEYDPDKLMAEIGISMDNDGLDEQQKFEYLHNNKSKLFKG